jgi:hypothetical protein
MEDREGGGYTRRVASILAAIAVVVLAGPAGASGQVPGRDADPVVLKGASLEPLLGADPGDFVAFRWTGSAWDQVPVQIDERAAVSYRQIYNNTAGCDFTCNDFTGTVTVYTDPDTWTGPDPDPEFDSDDELALMARDSGAQAPAGGPAGVLPNTRTALELTDPISGTRGYFVYLFQSDGSLDPSAGESYVDYDFHLTSGDYKSTYAIASGPNPETSGVATDFYSEDGLTDRWLDRGLRIFTGGSTGVDILDTDKVQFAPSSCGRSETTFSDAEGAFVTNTSGPVRAIRSYLGANSGPYTQREHVYYQRRQDVRTMLRVHGIPGVMSYLDYSPAASGMVYRNAANPSGLIIDGAPEDAAPSPGGPPWEQVTGAQGTLDIVSTLHTDIAPTPTLAGYYYDDSTPDGGHLQCSGDGSAFGASGTWITSALPATDPRGSGFKNLDAVRHMFYDAPNQPASQAVLRNQQIVSNLGVLVDGTVAIPAGPPPAVPSGTGQPPAGSQLTGKRAAALRKCRKRKAHSKRAKRARKKCLRRARKLPV